MNEALKKAAGPSDMVTPGKKQDASTSKGKWLTKPQRKLGPTGLIFLMVFASLMAPLSLDMYTPAVPHMSEYLNTTESLVNLTLAGYFLFFAIGLLVFGPISDRRGRKPVLLVGIISYTVASAGCALSFNIGMLILFRLIQAMGGGAVSAVMTAVVKDTIVPEKRDTVLSVVQIMAVVGPVVAPIAGALILQFSTWHATFWTLTVCGAVITVFSLLFDETLYEDERYVGSFTVIATQFKVVCSNKGFMAFLGVVATYNLPFMAYIAVGSYIYITFFGLTQLEYSLYFSACALLAIIGPFVYLMIARHTTVIRITTALLTASLLSGVGIVLLGQSSPLVFCAIFLILGFCEAASRPYSTNILLAQQSDDTAGTASSVINFAHTLVGSIGMLLAHLPWSNYVFGVGALAVITMLLGLAGWWALLHSKLTVKGVNDINSLH